MAQLTWCSNSASPSVISGHASAPRNTVSSLMAFPSIFPLFGLQALPLCKERVTGDGVGNAGSPGLRRAMRSQTFSTSLVHSHSLSPLAYQTVLPTPLLWQATPLSSTNCGQLLCWHSEQCALCWLSHQWSPTPSPIHPTFHCAAFHICWDQRSCSVTLRKGQWAGKNKDTKKLAAAMKVN